MRIAAQDNRHFVTFAQTQDFQIVGNSRIFVPQRIQAAIVNL